MIPESDMYRLVMKSKLPAAEKFEEWVMEEVLPTIRQTNGVYMIAVTYILL
jgi:anti-repressor protein